MYFGKGRSLKVTLRGGFKVNPFLAVIPPVVIFSLIFLSIDKLKIDVYQHDKTLLSGNSKELKRLSRIIIQKPKMGTVMKNLQ